MKHNLTVLISGVGGPTPKGVAKSLRVAFKDIKIIGTDANPYGPGLYAKDLYDKTYLVPKSASHPEEYWESMDTIINKENIDFAIIIPETEVLVWAKRQKNGALPCKALIPDYDVACFMFDKLQLSSLLYKNDLAPLTINFDKDKYKTFKEIQSVTSESIWMRANKTAGAIGALKLDDENDFIAWSVLFKHLKHEVIASEFLPGRNYAVKVLYDQGKVILSACAERIEYLLPNSAPSGISGMCSRGKLLNRKDLFELADKAVRVVFDKFDLLPNGYFTVDFKENSKGVSLITEINLRPVSFNFAFTLGGANFDKILISNFLLQSNNSNYNGFYTFEEELNFIRGVDYDLITISDNKLRQTL